MAYKWRGHKSSDETSHAIWGHPTELLMGLGVTDVMSWCGGENESPALCHGHPAIRAFGDLLSKLWCGHDLPGAVN